MGIVSGDPNITGDTGMNMNWINQNIEGQQDHTQASQSLVDNHNDLHSEIEDNDLNPKDANKKVKVVVQQA